MFTDIRRLSSPTGVLLAYRYAPAQQPARGIVLVCHGLAEHAGRYQQFAEGMAAMGYHVYAHDHRGHGLTASPERPLGRFAVSGGPDKVIADVLAMRELAVAEHKGLPVILFGHSMGGLIALNAAVAKPDGFDALAIWNSRFNTGVSGHFARRVLAIERILKGSDVPSGILPKASFAAWNKEIPDARTDHDWLSTDPNVPQQFMDDPYCGFDISVSMWDDVFELTQRPMRRNALAGLPRSLPIHLVGGRHDPATHGGKDIEWLAQRLSRAGFARLTCQIYPDMRHETLQEYGREAATADFAEWCGRVTPARTGEMVA